MTDLVIVDYGACNVSSMRNMLQRIGVEAKISRERSDIESANRLILPGVGAFDHGVQTLHDKDLVGCLNEAALNRKIPVLGVCLGAQLMTQGSEEGEMPGLGWIDADTVGFDRSQLSVHDRIPHMGWSDTSFTKGRPLVGAVLADSRFYYVHSYHFSCKNTEDVLCQTEYGYRFVAGFMDANIVGVQFHPEKSHKFGMAFLRAFVDFVPEDPANA